MNRALSYVLVLAAWSAALVLGFGATGLAARGYYWLVALAVPYFLGPAAAAWLWRRFVAPDAPPVDMRLRAGNWLIVAWLAPVVAVWLAALVAHLAGWGALDLSGAPIVARKAFTDPAEAARLQAELDGAPLPFGVYASIRALIVGAMMFTPIKLAEEAGWRGVLLRELRPLGFWGAAVVSALLWAAWYVPLAGMGLVVPEATPIALAGLFCTLSALGVLLAWLREAAGTLWASAAASGTLTALSAFHEYVLGGPERPEGATLGLSGAIAFALLVVVAAALRGGRPPIAPGDAQALPRAEPA
jgi:membrane protease YdiL (CAAX protease family)